MQWSPSFKCQLSEGGEQRYVVGQELIDEFSEFVAGRARPNTVRAYAHDLCVFFSVVDKVPAEVTAKRRAGLRHLPASGSHRRRERGRDLRRADGTLGGDDQAASGRGVQPLWLPGYPRRRRDQREPGPARHRHSPEPRACGQGAAARARGAALAQDPRPRRRRGAARRAADRARSGHGPGDAPRRLAAL